jgi:hypothetical protein
MLLSVVNMKQLAHHMEVVVDKKLDSRKAIRIRNRPALVRGADPHLRKIMNSDILCEATTQVAVRLNRADRGDTKDSIQRSKSDEQLKKLLELLEADELAELKSLLLKVLQGSKEKELKSCIFLERRASIFADNINRTSTEVDYRLSVCCC